MDVVGSIFSRLYTQDSLIECIFLAAGCNGAPSEAEIKLLYRELNVLKSFVTQLPLENGQAVLYWRNKLASFWSRMISLKKTESACRIQQKLIVVECSIIKLFTLCPPPIDLLKERLKELEDVAACLPVECVDLSLIWRKKISDFWLQFSSAAAYGIPAFSCDNFPYISLHDNTHPITSPIVNMNLDPFWNPLMTSTLTFEPSQQVDNYGNAIVNNVESDFNSLENQSRSDLADNYNEINNQEHLSGKNNEQSIDPSNDGHELDKDVSLESICQEIRNSFSLIKPISSGSDVDGMKSILKTISTVGKLILPYHDHINYLKTEIFNCTVSKLPCKKRTHFRKRSCDNRYPLSNLVRMLLIDIVACTQCESSPSNFKGKFGSTRFIFDCCIICQLKGHRISTCPFIHLMLCCKCFDFGHFGKHCTLTS